MAKVLLAFVSMFAATLAFASPAARFVGSCRYYDQISNELGCGPEDYFLKYGANFCREFEAGESRFSPEGQLFLRQTRLCLQKEFEKQRGLACSNARARSVRVHLNCFERYRFCALPFMDKFLIFRTVAPAIFDSEMPGGASDFHVFCR